MYPYALNILLTNPEKSAVIENTLQQLIRDPVTGRFDSSKFDRILRDSALATGFSRRKVMWDIVKTEGGRKLGLRIGREEIGNKLTRIAKSDFLKL